MAGGAPLRSVSVHGDRNGERGRHPPSTTLAGVPLMERRLELNGVPTAPLEGGDGSPLVLIHGAIVCGGAHWAPVIAERYRVVVPDLPGLGESEPAGNPIEPAFPEWFSELLHTTCDEPPAIGHYRMPPVSWWPRSGSTCVRRFATRSGSSGGRSSTSTGRSGKDSAWLDTSSALEWPLHVVEDAGHVPHLDEPDRFVRALSEALAD